MLCYKRKKSLRARTLVDELKLEAAQMRPYPEQVLRALRVIEPATIDEIGRAIGDPSWAMNDDRPLIALMHVLRDMVDSGAIRLAPSLGQGRRIAATKFYALPKNSS